MHGREVRPAGKGRRGAIAVEVALALAFILIPTLLGILEVGRLVEVQAILNAAVREGGRQASTGRLSNAAIRTSVLSTISNAGLATTNATVTVTNLTSAGADSLHATQFDRLEVVASVPFRDTRWVNLPLVTTDATLVTARVVWDSMKDQSYPSPPEPGIE